MRISVQWLQDWLDSVPEPRELAARLTMAGLEVEGVEAAAPPLAGVVVGEIISREAHPNADSLSICQVSVGSETVQIVCGAPNARAGMKAPLATVGARLPGGMQIGKAKLRGVESFGMLCSAKELGLDADASGLLELSPDLINGAPLVEALGLDDTLLEINLTPNRGDCMSVLGVAREVATLTGAQLKATDLRPLAPAIEATFPVELEAAAGCVRFASRVIRGVRPGAKSPSWMRERLRRAGLRPINAAVDVTNYVMLELGQPMHAYDLRDIDGAVVVRRARPQERLTLLDGREITLDESVLIIADRSKPIALAGVMGGEHSGIKDDTVDVLFEVAFFLPDAIAGRGRRYGLVTDASQRFERGVDPTLQHLALERATQLLCDCAGGMPGPVQLTELPDELPVHAAIRLRPQRARQVIGAEISDGDIETILTGLGMAVNRGSGDWRVTAPSWRFDVAIEEDLIEEIARVYGFDRIPEAQQPARQGMPRLSETVVALDSVADALVQRGYHEAITYSFVEPALQARFFPDAATLQLSNPISAELAAMRISLWPGLVAALQSNQRRQQARVRLFEVGRKFIVGDGGLQEVSCVAGIAAGAAAPEQWGSGKDAVDFFDVKADLLAMLGATCAKSEFVFEPDRHPTLHPGQTARIIRNGVAVGWLGRLHPELERSLELTYSAVLFEVETEVGLVGRLPHYQEISRFPAVRRDLALTVDEAVTVRQLVDRIRAVVGATLRDLVVFDIYRGSGIERGRKSVAIGLNLQDVSRTLTDVEIDSLVVQVRDDLERGLGAAIRDK
jgi:phenylalanyl-tRNA synthetase beta chain